MACNHSTLTAWQTLQRLDYVDGVICFGHQQPHRNKSSPFFSSSSNNITMMMPRILQHTHTTSSRLFINAYIYFYVYIFFYYYLISKRYCLFGRVMCCCVMGGDTWSSTFFFVQIQLHTRVYYDVGYCVAVVLLCNIYKLLSFSLSSSSVL